MLELGFIPELDFDDDDFLKELNEFFGELHMVASEEVLMHIIKHVPVETGMAKASLRPIAEVFGVSVPIDPIRNPYYSKLEERVQSIPSGEASPTFQVLSHFNNGVSLAFSTEFSPGMLHYWDSRYYSGSLPSGEVLIATAETIYESAIDTLNDLPEVPIKWK